MPRPSFRATKETRKLVKSLAAIGLPQEQIAVAIGIRSAKTVRKHFREELACGMAEANAAVTRAAYEMAVSGKMPVMTRFWLATAGRPANHERELYDEGDLDAEDWEDFD